MESESAYNSVMSNYVNRSGHIKHFKKRKLDNMFEDNEMISYFEGQPKVDKISSKTSSYFNNKVIESVDALIYMGSLSVDLETKSVEELLDHVKIS